MTSSPFRPAATRPPLARGAWRRGALCAALLALTPTTADAQQHDAERHLLGHAESGEPVYCQVAELPEGADPDGASALRAPSSGRVSLLRVRVQFAGETANLGFGDLPAAEAFLEQRSLGELDLAPTEGPMVYLSKTRAQYRAEGDNAENDWRFITDQRWYREAVQKAAAAGYDPARYDILLLSSEQGQPFVDWFGGWGQYGGKIIMSTDPNPMTTAHEVGHTFNLYHANGRFARAGNPVAGGTGERYNRFDIMGRVPAVGEPTSVVAFGAAYMRAAGWVTAAEFPEITRSGTYRIYAPDRAARSAGLPVGLFARPAAADPYGTEDSQDGLIIETRESDSRVNGGVLLLQPQSVKNGRIIQTNLIDVRTDTPNNYDDAALLLNETFDYAAWSSDPADRVKVRPVASGTDAVGRWVDVELTIDGVPPSPPQEPTVVAEAGFVSVAQASSTSWTTVTVARAFTTPVVVAGARSHNEVYDDAEGRATVRVRNVRSSGGQTTFQLQVDEWDYLDGAHSTEEVSYLVAEAGVHPLAGGAVLEAGTTTLDHDWKTVALAARSGQVPAVFTQATSYNGRAAVTTRHRSINTFGFQVRLQEEEGADGTHLAESLSYVALSGGTGEGAPFQIGSIQTDGGWELAEFTGARAPVLAAVQTFAGGDPVSMWASPVYDGRLYLRMEEEQSRDAETAHTTETVAYAVLQGPFEVASAAARPLAAREPAPTERAPLVDALAVAVYPNPSAAGAGATVRLAVPAAAPGRVVLYDVLGREAAVLAEGALAAGTAELAVPRDLAPGLYLVRAVVGGAAQTVRLTVTR